MRKLRWGVLAALAVGLAAVIGSSAATAGSSHKSANTRIVTVVKLRGVGWFDRMEQGIKQFAKANKVDATMTGAEGCILPKPRGLHR